MTGIDDAEIHFARIDLTQVFDRSSGRLGLYRDILKLFYRFVDLDGIGNDLECAASWSAAEDDSLFAGLGALKLESYAVYPVLIFYFFPVGNLLKAFWQKDIEEGMKD